MIPPAPYQVTGAEFLAARRFALLADEMRVRKSRQAIMAAQKIGAMKTIVVCPAIAVTHWGNEWLRWWPGQSNVHPIVVSFDRFRLNADGILANDWDLAIVDECHFAKNPQAQRTKLVYGKDGLVWKAKRLWALSGTPAPKHAGELWPMLYAFGATELGYYDFTHRYCDFDWTRTNIKGTKVARIPELKEILAKVMLRRMRKDVAPEMPDISYNFLEMAPGRVDLQGVPEAADLASWAEKQTADREDRIAVAKAKVPGLVAEIAEAVAEGLLAQTVVFGWHKEPLEQLAQGLRGRGLTVEIINGDTPPAKRAKIQADFKAGLVQVVAANIIAAGMAIDLSAASHGYFLELGWVPGVNVQAANRLVSMDKTEKVTMDVVTWPGSADDRVQRALLRRATELAKLY